MYKLRIKLLLALMLLFSSGNIFAQEAGPPPGGVTGDVSGLPFDLLPPGARALGLGGAFTAVADDATAALANPGGLTNLTAPEVSVFLRYTDADVNFLDPDAYNSALNAYSGDLHKKYSDSSTKVSFASFVYPLERWVFSGFYSNQLAFNGVQSAPDVVFDDIDRGPDAYPYFDKYTNLNGVKAEVENFGLSGAFRFTDEFSAGVTLRRAKFKLDSEDTWQIDWWNDWEQLMAEEFYGASPTVEQVASFLPVVNDSYTYGTSAHDSDSKIVVDFGLYYKGDKWSLGATYHAGAKYEISTVGSLASQFSCNGEGDLTNECQSWVDLVDELELTDEFYPNVSEAFVNTIRLPSIISFGVAFRPAETWLISFDLNIVEYSVLNPPRNNTLGFDLDIDNESARSEFYDPDIRELEGPITKPIENGVNYHLGLEKSFVFDHDFLRTLALRGGVFTIKDHNGIVAISNSDTVWTVGIGSTWGKNELGAKVFQVDLGASFADDTTNVVLSGIMRF